MEECQRQKSQERWWSVKAVLMCDHSHNACNEAVGSEKTMGVAELSENGTMPDVT